MKIILAFLFAFTAIYTALGADGDRYFSRVKVLIERGDYANLKLMLEDGLDPNIKNSQERGSLDSPLSIAMEKCQANIIDLLIAHGATLDMYSLATAVIEGCYYGADTMMKMGVNPANFNPRKFDDDDDATLMGYALEDSKHEDITMLLASHPTYIKDLLTKEKLSEEQKSKILDIAIKNLNFNLVKKLINADHFAISTDNLIYIEESEQGVNMLKLLLQYSDDVDQNDLYSTIIIRGDKLKADFLREQGAIFNADIKRLHGQIVFHDNTGKVIELAADHEVMPTNDLMVLLGASIYTFYIKKGNPIITTNDQYMVYVKSLKCLVAKGGRYQEMHLKQLPSEFVKIYKSLI